MTYSRRDLIAAVLVALLAIIVAMGMASCGGSERPLTPVPAPAPGVGDQLRSLGSVFLWWGGIVLGLGVVARVALWIAIPASITALLPGCIGGICALVAEGGAVAVACGAAFTWLADYLWLVVLACLLSAGGWAWLHRARVRRWLGIGKAEVIRDR